MLVLWTGTFETERVWQEDMPFGTSFGPYQILNFTRERFILTFFFASTISVCEHFNMIISMSGSQNMV